MTDRRSFPANDRVAAEELRGRIDGVSFVTGQRMRIDRPVADLCAAPSGPRDRQMLFGQAVEVFEDRAGWAFVRALRDGYVGYLPSDALGAWTEPTHRITARASHAYARCDIKSPDSLALPHGAELSVRALTGGFAETAEGFVPRQHIAELTRHARDPLAVARLFLGTPYLWGGNSHLGIDCSGLVQTACLAAGIACPGDSDQQLAALGTAVDGPMQVGDLLFWEGHVAFVDHGNHLLHANAHHMAVVSEPLHGALGRIVQDAGPILAHKRLTRS